VCVCVCVCVHDASKDSFAQVHEYVQRS